MEIKKSDQHHLGFGLEHPQAFGSWWQCVLPFKALQFGEWIVLEDAWIIASNNSFQQVGFSFELLQNVLTHLHTPLLLSFIQQPWYHSCTDLPHNPIFRNDPPYPLTIHTQLICFHSNSKMAIGPNLLSHTLNVFICSASGWPPTPLIIFHLLSSLFEPPVPLKRTSSWHRVIIIDFLKQLWCFSWSFSKTDKKFRVDSLFDAHPSHQRKKSQNYQIFTKLSQRKCLDRKTCRKECSCHRMLKFGFWDHKTLWHHRKQCFSLQ